MDKYVTVLTETQCIGEEIFEFETLFTDFKEGLKRYGEYYKKYEALKKLMQTICEDQSVEFNDDTEYWNTNGDARGANVQGVITPTSKGYLSYSISLKQMTEQEYEDQKKVYVLYYKHTVDDQEYADEALEFASFSEAKKCFDEHMPEYERIKRIIRETCEPHSLCEEEQMNYINENLNVFIDSLISKDSELYKEGNNVLYQLTILPLTKKEVRESKDSMQFRPIPESEQPEELLFK